MNRLLAPPVLLLGVLSLSACDAAGDAVGEAAGRAGCAVAQRAVDEVATQARDVASDLGADPAAAQRRLEGLRDSLDTAGRGLDGEAGQQVSRARDALDQLATQARSAAEGTAVDDVAVQEAERELDAAVDDLTTIC